MVFDHLRIHPPPLILYWTLSPKQRAWATKGRGQSQLPFDQETAPKEWSLVNTSRLVILCDVILGSDQGVWGLHRSREKVPNNDFNGARTPHLGALNSIEAPLKSVYFLLFHPHESHS